MEGKGQDGVGGQDRDRIGGVRRPSKGLVGVTSVRGGETTPTEEDEKTDHLVTTKL